MNITLKPSDDGKHQICCCRLIFCGLFTLDQLEDLEMNLTDVIKQLQDYRLAQVCIDEKIE